MKFDYRNLLLIVGSTVITLVILEIGLRIAFLNRSDLLVKHSQDREFLSKFSYWKYWHFPDNVARHQSDCYEAVYETNSLGFKYKEIDPEKPVIALVGDSYIEGYGTSNTEMISHYLDSLTQGKYQFVPFAASGGFGTGHELAMYESFVRYFEPDLVILFFLNYNDFYDNLNALADGLISEEGRILTSVAPSLEEAKSAIRNMRQPKELKSDIYFYSIALAHRGLRFIGNAIQYSRNVNGNFKDAIAEIYAVEPEDNVREAYDLTGRLLGKFHAATTRDSLKLTIVNLFDPFQVDDNWIEVMSKKVDKELDPEIPNRYISEVCATLNTEYIDLFPIVKGEILRKNMKFPYFSHDCDNHLTGQGNKWVAQVLLSELNSRQLIN